ncbi:NAD(P)H dehydrogenase [quinone] 1-like isoform X2 [Pygocentrus nattereri]|uniref:NAD(P)H dehydrogenase [quinone] 1-like isoform X2 n=1 Tax=Pygocentrus nattereri TaxID=42514 RepID=UPI001890FB46|nr:NAD(P)H dehydrogenase [quinone] 1-like isoform X2 [Pygocentrus nattereri]
MALKTVLIIYAHHSPSSFNAAAKDVAMQTLTAQGFKVIVSDLYAMNFRSSATAADIKSNLKNPEHFLYGDETFIAWKEDRLSDDIKEEQRKVAEADLIIFQDKKAVLSFTTGGMESMYLPDGLNGDINVMLWPLQNGVLRFCGFQVLAPQIFWCVADAPPSERTAMLEAWQARLKGMLDEQPLSFAPTKLFDLSVQGGFRLCSDMKEAYASQPYGLTTGQHLGKPLPPNNQMKASPHDNH